jgi:hypothetical protein
MDVCWSELILESLPEFEQVFCLLFHPLAYKGQNKGMDSTFEPTKDGKLLAHLVKKRLTCFENATMRNLS